MSSRQILHSVWMSTRLDDNLRRRKQYYYEYIQIPEDSSMTVIVTTVLIPLHTHLEHFVIGPVGSPFRVCYFDNLLEIFTKFHVASNCNLDAPLVSLLCQQFTRSRKRVVLLQNHFATNAHS
jgi:hypothetical protein